MSNAIGFCLAMFAGASVGFSMWPLKWARVWRWENFWLLYSFFSLILVPFLIAFASIPHLLDLYRQLPNTELLRPFLLGTLWGVAQLGAGLCVRSLGLAVAGAVLNGVGAAFGIILPLLSLHAELASTASGLLLIVGTIVLLAGAALCGWSGYLREEEAKRRGQGAGFGLEEIAMRQSALTKNSYFLMLGAAVLSGVLASLLNVALAYGTGITRLAEQMGARPAMAPFAVWPLALLGGSIVNIAYSIVLIQKNNNWVRFKGDFKEVFYPFLSACMWMGGIALYSSGTTYLGVLGISIGFAVFMLSMILGGQLAGVMTGEWHLMTPRTSRSFAIGVGLLVLAVMVVGGSRYFSR